MRITESAVNDVFDVGKEGKRFGKKKIVRSRLLEDALDVGLHILIDLGR